METPQVQVGAENTDVEMDGAQETTQATQATQEAAHGSTQPETAQDVTLPDQPSAPAQQSSSPEKKSYGLRFLDYLTSPIVKIAVGKGDEETVLTAHQKLLVESPFLAETVARFDESGPRRINLPDESVNAFGCFLQFQYTGDYSPLQAAPGRSEQDTVSADVDDSGEQLLKHAHVYTLAEKLGMPALKTLAHSKIHRINSTARGEMAYARYVYQNTLAEDITIRKPVANFWATRGHVLRHEAEEEFKTLCLEVSEFSFDVLSLVLDQKEKRAHERAEAESGVKGSARKRLRNGL